MWEETNWKANIDEKKKKNKGKAWAQCNFELGPGGLFTHCFNYVSRKRI